MARRDKTYLVETLIYGEKKKLQELSTHLELSPDRSPKVRISRVHRRDISTDPLISDKGIYYLLADVTLTDVVPLWEQELWNIISDDLYTDIRMGTQISMSYSSYTDATDCGGYRSHYGVCTMDDLVVPPLAMKQLEECVEHLGSINEIVSHMSDTMFSQLNKRVGQVVRVAARNNDDFNLLSCMSTILAEMQGRIE